SFFITVNGLRRTAESIEDARTNIECQPAKDDPSGHWGPIIHGYELSIRFKQDIFRTNEPVIATVIDRNAGTNILNHGSPYGGDLDFSFVIKNEEGDQLIDSFMPTRTTGQGEGWIPGTQYKYECNLTKRYGLSVPGRYSISVHRRLPNPDGRGAIDLSSGTATIRITF
ncbi:MAG TPA: hypothetical protein VMH30_07185, partial [Verrucomicrobiae bacterium]|nr:hypothetical protein [Verrucomicrobiae bacterium]